MNKDINTASSKSTENLGADMPDDEKKITPKKGGKKNTVIINPQLDDKPNDEPVSYDVIDNPINEAALTALQRMRRGQTMRRIAPKLKRAREMAQHRIAGEGKLSERAMRHARGIIRDRLIGKAGVKYADMDYASKIRIDKMLETKVGAIKRLALRLVPNERRTEQSRHHEFTHKDMADHNAHKKDEKIVAEETIEGTAKRLVNSTSHTPERAKLRIQALHNVTPAEAEKQYRAAKKLAESYDKLDGATDTKHTTRYKQEVILGKDGKERVVNRAVKIKSVEEGLLKKSETTGIPLEALQEVYARGLETYDNTKYPTLTVEQYAYGRVNKFVAELNSIDEDVKSRFRAKLRKES